MTAAPYSLLAALRDWLASLSQMLTDPASPFWWPTLIAMVGGIVLAFVLAPPSRRRLRDALPPGGLRPMAKELPWDIGLMLANSALPFIAAPILFVISLGGAWLGALVAAPVFGTPGDAAPGFWGSLFCTFLAFVGMDFVRYWTHVLFHRVPALWALHRKHHEPAVLTPITAFRFWPQEQIIHLLGAFLGLGFGAGLGATMLGATATPPMLAGVNVFTVAWGVGFAHLRHSHVPLSFPRWLSYLLVSPVMHQAHHSADPAQHDRNFATVFSVWDWMFGTLYMTRPGERFRFGLGAEEEDGPSKPPA